jgi:hypothetical protein
MCRIMCLSNVSKIKDADKLNKVMLKLRDVVSEANRDGFGYAVSYKSSVYSQKFLKPDDFVGLDATSLHAKMTLPIFDNSASWESGIMGERPLSIIAHGRTSTNFRGDVMYSHPFVNDDNAFIHNGVVDVPRKHDYNLITDNDSEYLANVYWKHGTQGLSKINGYFAFMNLRLNGKVEIEKDNIAGLYAAYIPELDSYVFATMEKMILAFSNAMGYQTTSISPVQSMQYFTVQGSVIRNMAPISKSEAPAKRLTALEKKAFKDYNTTDYKGTKVLGNDYASMPSKFSDPYYWQDDTKEFYGRKGGK